LQSLRRGYRIVPLFDSKWVELTFSNLCVRVALTTTASAPA
jgi:hypothetical protein